MNADFEFRTVNGVKLLVPKPIENSGAARCFFSTRCGGVSEKCFASLNLSYSAGDDSENVRENFRRLFKSTGTEPGNAVASFQVHEDNVIRVTEEHAGNGFTKKNMFTSADALVTDVKGLTLLVFYADCVPVTVLDAKRGVAAAIHSGWRGTAKKIVKKTVEIMKNEYGCRGEDLMAAVGPHIQKCCYEVSDDVAKAMNEGYGDADDGFLADKGNGKFMLDLGEAVKYCLLEGGVDEKRIYQSGECTSCKNDVYFSHRAQKGKKGIMCSGITLI